MRQDREARDKPKPKQRVWGYANPKPTKPEGLPVAAILNGESMTKGDEYHGQMDEHGNVAAVEGGA